MIHVTLFDTHIAIECSATVQQVLMTCWPRASSTAPNGEPWKTLTITDAGKNSWIIEGDGIPPLGPASGGDFVKGLAGIIVALVTERESAMPISAGVVSSENKQVFVFGREKTGRSMLIAWLMQQGFALLSDNNVLFEPSAARCASLAGPLFLSAHKDAKTVQSLPDFKSTACIEHQQGVAILSDPEWVLDFEAGSPDFLIFVEYDGAAERRISALTEAEIRTKLRNCHEGLTDAELEALFTHVAHAPAIVLRYAKYGDLDHLLDQLCHYVLRAEPSQTEFNGFLARISDSNARDAKTHPIPERSDRTLTPRLTIGMATYDDYDGVYFSIQAIRMYHPEILDQVEFLVLDNNPEGPCSAPLKKLERNIPNFRYIPNTDIKGTAVRDHLFSEAFGEFVLSMDCHVFFAPGALSRLLHYYAENPDTNDLLQGPLFYDDLRSVATHFEPRWQQGMYGTWSPVETEFDANKAPFEIPAQGLGVFSCRKAAWLGFNKAFRGFGGEEGYIHQKYRNAGHKTLCLPFLRWMHRFDRPFGVPYRNNWEDRVRNYMIGWKEAGLPVDEMLDHFRDLIGKKPVQQVLRDLEREAQPLVVRQRST